MKLIGLTGGVASGKSTVSMHLAEKGFPVIDTDLIVRDLLEYDKRVRRALETDFGTTERSQIRKIVFSDAEKRRRLEEILHPRVTEVVQERVAALQKHRPPRTAAVVMVPLLFEVNWDKRFDIVLAVLCKPEIQNTRLMARDNIDRGLAEKMISSQLPNEQKEKRAQYVIWNNGTPEDLKRSVDKFLVEISSSL